METSDIDSLLKKLGYTVETVPLSFDDPQLAKYETVADLPKNIPGVKQRHYEALRRRREGLAR